MNTDKFYDICVEAIKKYYKEHLNRDLDDSDIYCVWACKTLQNNKMLLSTTIPDHRYIECTGNGDKSEMYLDVYVKEHNECIKY